MKENREKEIIMKSQSEDDFNKSIPQDKKEAESKFEKYEILTTNVLFSLMIFFTTIGTALIILKLEEFLEPLRKTNLDYNFPSLFDFKITLITLPILCVIVFFYLIHKYIIYVYFNYFN